MCLRGHKVSWILLGSMSYSSRWTDLPALSLGGTSVQPQSPPGWEASPEVTRKLLWTQPRGPRSAHHPPPTPALRTTDWRGEQGPGTGMSKDVSGRTRSEQRSFCGPHPRRPPDSRPQAGPLLPAGTEPTSRPQQRGSPSQGCERVN